MSRSRRKTPICGITTAASEKLEKRKYNRAFRHATRRFLRHAEPEDDLPPQLRDYSDPWAMSKDGKTYFDPRRFPECLRK
jgi:hypothetical protein